MLIFLLFTHPQTIQDGDSMDNIPGYNASERHSQLNSIGQFFIFFSSLEKTLVGWGHVDYFESA